MDITIQPRLLRGQIHAIPSKSQAHRLLICAAFADKPTDIICPETNRDIEATANCLDSLCCSIIRKDFGYRVTPYGHREATPGTFTLNCHESGSTLRFLLPVMGALGERVCFKMEGRLPRRPLSPLWEEMERMGCRLSWAREDELLLTGKLQPGDYYISGSVSSQFITGLLFAAALMDGDSTIHITGKPESLPYIIMTQKAMALFGVETKDFHVKGGQKFRSPGTITVEGDWSNAAFFLAAKQLGSEVSVLGLDPDSAQGDRAVVEILSRLSRGNATVSAADIPDLIPVLSVVAAAGHGGVFTDIQRLRLKESDRVASVIAMLNSLGGHAEATESTLTVHPSRLTGGTVNAMNDHRIAMSAAVAATVCTRPVTILGAECVEKSYPRFWEEYKHSGGQYEQHLR